MPIFVSGKYTFRKFTFGKYTFVKYTFGKYTFVKYTFGKYTFGKQAFGKYTFRKIQPRYPDPKLKNDWGPLSSTFHVGQPETLIEWKLDSIRYGPTDGQTDMARC